MWGFDLLLQEKEGFQFRSIMEAAENDSCYPAGVPDTGPTASGTVVADRAERSAAGAAGAAGAGGGHPRAAESDRGVQLLPERGHTVPVALHGVQGALQRPGTGQPGHGAGGQLVLLPAELGIIINAPL